MTDANDLIAQRLSAILDDLKNAQAGREKLSSYDARRIITRARAAVGRYAPPHSAYEEETLAIDGSPASDDRSRTACRDHPRAPG